MKPIKIFLGRNKLNLGKKTSIYLAVCIVLCACGGSDSHSPRYKESMSGTWLYTNETRYYEKDSGEYAYSDYSETTLIVEESDDGIIAHRCENYPLGNFMSGFRTDNNSIYLDDRSYPFRFASETVLEQEEADLPYEFESDPFLWRATATMQWISDEVEIANGMITFEGPLEVPNSEQVCYEKRFQSFGNENSLHIIVPFGSSRYGPETIRLQMFSRQHIAPAVYNVESELFNDVVMFEVNSDADEFIDQVGSFLVWGDGVLSIIEHDERRISGSYSITEFDSSDEYFGVFELDFPTVGE